MIGDKGRQEEMRRGMKKRGEMRENEVTQEEMRGDEDLDRRPASLWNRINDELLVRVLES